MLIALTMLGHIAALRPDLAIARLVDILAEGHGWTSSAVWEQLRSAFADDIGLLVAHGLFIFIGVRSIAAGTRRKLWPYVLGYLALYAITVGGARDPLLFISVLLLYSVVYHIPLLVGYVFLFAVSYGLMTQYSHAVFALSALVLTGAMGLRRSKLGAFFTGAHLIGFLLLAVVLLPLVQMITSEDSQNVFMALEDAAVRDAIWVSLKTSTITTLIVLLLGIPLAYVMVRTDFPGKSVADNLIDLPILIPQPVVGIAILTCMAPGTRLGAFLKSTTLGGLLAEPLGFHIDGTIWGIIAAQVFVSSPFLVRAAMTAFQGIDPKLEKVARTLGARPGQAFWSVALPLAMKGIFTGCILTWARAISEYAAINLITYDPACASIKIYDTATVHGVKEARPAAVLLVMTCLWIFIMLRLIRTYAVGGPLAGFIRGKLSTPPAAKDNT